MKKSQVLAALALAFALGVVAPVAGTISSTSTYAAEARAVESATKQDVLDAVKKIENYGTYKNFASVIELKEHYSEEGIMDGTDTAISSYTAEGIINSIASAVKAINGSNPTYATLNSAINMGQRVDNYGVYAQLYNYLQKDDKDINPATVVTYIKAINSDKNTTIKELDAIDTSDVTTLRNFVNGTGWSLAETYGKYAALVAAVNNGNIYADFVTDMTNALNAVQTWTGANKDAVADAAKNATDPAKALVDLVTDANIEGLDEYTALYTEIANINDGTTSIDNFESSNNQGIINTLNTKLEAASEVVPGDKVSLKDLTLPTDAGDGTNTPDTNPGDETKDPTAPDTGIIADAEGNASTTVAMVAGVATALTAAGAGVVAYRNARRSTRK